MVRASLPHSAHFLDSLIADQLDSFQSTVALRFNLNVSVLSREDQRAGGFLYFYDCCFARTRQAARRT